MYLLTLSIKITPGSADLCAISANLFHNSKGLISPTFEPSTGVNKSKVVPSSSDCINLSVIRTEIFILANRPSTSLQFIKSLTSGCQHGIAHKIAARRTRPPDFVVSPTASYNFINESGPLL